MYEVLIGWRLLVSLVFGVTCIDYRVVAARVDMSLKRKVEALLHSCFHSVVISVGGWVGFILV
jgi:hypothetical protein